MILIKVSVIIINQDTEIHDIVLLLSSMSDTFECLKLIHKILIIMTLLSVNFSHNAANYYVSDCNVYNLL